MKPKKLIIPQGYGDPNRVSILSLNSQPDPELTQIREFIVEALDYQEVTPQERNELMRNELPDDIAIIIWWRLEYAQELERIHQINPNIPWLRTRTREQFIQDPHLPAVLKTNTLISDRWEGIYLLETPEQIQQLQELYSFNKQFHSAFLLQEYIPTPGNNHTSIRITITNDGEILSWGLLVRPDDEQYRAEQSSYHNIVGTPLQHFLESTNSPYYLHSRDIRSNGTLGSAMIPLWGEHRHHTPQQQDVLSQHHITDGILPDQLIQWAKDISSALWKEYGILLGIDFIQGENWQRYYLETNPGPWLRDYLECMWVDTSHFVPKDLSRLKSHISKELIIQQLQKDTYTKK